MDAFGRTRELLGSGNTIGEIVQTLRDDGFSMIESMSALISRAELPFDDAKAAVIDSPVWADQRDRVSTNRWVDPPELPDSTAVGDANPKTIVIRVNLRDHGRVVDDGTDDLVQPPDERMRGLTPKVPVAA